MRLTMDRQLLLLLLLWWLLLRLGLVAHVGRWALGAIAVRRGAVVRLLLLGLLLTSTGRTLGTTLRAQMERRHVQGYQARMLLHLQ